MTKTPKRPRDTNQLAKLMVDILTGQVKRAKTQHLFVGRSKRRGAATFYLFSITAKLPRSRRPKPTRLTNRKPGE